MRVLLANAPWRKDGRYGVRAGSRWPFTTKIHKKEFIPSYIPFPFFLAYATALLERESFSVRLIDAIAESDDNQKFIKKIKNFNPDLVLLETSTPSIYEDLRAAQVIKNELGAEVALSGPHASVYPRELLENNFVDYILVGEYEYTLLDLIEHIDKEADLHDVKGLAFKADNNVVLNERRPVISDLDELPWPARHFLPMYNYNDAFAGMPCPNVQMWASRGCPYRCIFCLWPSVMYGGHQYRVRNPVDVVNEMEFLIEKYKFKAIYFDDDTFNIGKRRILKLCEEIKSRGINVPWAVMARADTSDKNMLTAMREAGLYAIKYGIEDTNQHILTSIKKNLDINKVRKTMEITKKLGIKSHLTLTIGLPGQTKETMKNTIKFVTDVCPDSIQVSICIPFPGTEYYDIAEKNGWILTKDWSKYDGSCSAVIKTDSLSASDIEELLRATEKMLRKQLLRRKLRSNLPKYLMIGMKKPIDAFKSITNIV